MNPTMWSWRTGAATLAGAACAGVVCMAAAAEPAAMIAAAKKSPAPPWPAGDERGMANALGRATTQRCAWHMAQRGARVYEASSSAQQHHAQVAVREPRRDAAQGRPPGVPFSAHAFNSEVMQADAEPAQQGTQLDALGHFARIKNPWDPKTPFPADEAVYYGGFTQKDVKPTPDSPLLKLGIDKIPPLVTTAVLLDARALRRQGAVDERRPDSSPPRTSRAC